jgi:hypothetical protein
MLITYVIAVVLGLSLLCLIAFWLVVIEANKPPEPPPLPKYGEDHE